MPGRVYVVVGLPGIGRTGVALSIAHSIAQRGLRVLLFSLQLAAPVLARRVLCAQAGLDSPEGQQADRPATTDLGAQLEQVGGIALTIDDAPIFAWSDLMERICGARSLVVIDGLEFMVGRSDGESEGAELWRLLAGLRRLARRKEVPILATVRPTSDGARTHEHGAALRWADIPGAVLAQSDAVLQVYGPAYHDRGASEDHAWVRTEHDRWGPGGVGTLRYSHPGWFEPGLPPGVDWDDFGGQV